MWLNYFKVAFRSLVKNKTTSVVNILGLSLGVTVLVLISLYVHHEYSFDHWIPESERTYRILRYWEGENSHTVWSPSLLAGKLRDEFPEIENASGLGFEGEVLIGHEAEKIYVKKVAQVDSTFFDVMKIPFRDGSAANALRKPKSLVITHDLARRLFGDDEALGKIVQFDKEPGYTISGILNMNGQHSHLNYEVYTTFLWYSDSWTGNNRATYVKVNPSAEIDLLEQKITSSVNNLIKQELAKINYDPKPEDLAQWQLQPVNEIHLASGTIGWINSTGGDKKYIYIFMAIAFLVMIIAIINYVNLSTAQATDRAKEVAIRKVSGAHNNQLIKQFLAESMLQTLLASLLGLGLAEFFLPIFEAIVDRDLQLMGSAVFPMVVLLTLLLSIFLGILSGLYPAIGLSSMSPVNIFQDKKSSSGAGRFRRILVTSQFSISIGLLILMAFIFKQVNLMLESDLGFKPDQVLKITLNDKTSHRKIEQLRSQFMSIPGVSNITTSSRLPGQSLPDWGMTQEGVEDMLNPRVLFTDPYFLKTLDIPLVSGRFLSADFAADTVNNFIVNEAFVREFNLAEPLGTKVKFSFDDEFGEIVGVCQNFHYSGVQSDVAPLAISGAHNRWYAGIEMSTTNVEGTISKIKDVWHHIEPEHPIRMSFLDEEFAAQYRTHRQFGRSMLYATILTLLIALMGLFGLTTFSVQKRLKEIGIRKVLGSTTSGILLLFSRDFIKIVILAFLIGAPLSLFFTNKWLENFATRIHADVWTFLAALAIVLIVTILTVGIKTFAAARNNPVQSLRDE